MRGLISIVFVHIHWQLVQGGLCWTTILKNGRCQHLYKTNLSKEECCKNGRISMAWSPHAEATPTRLFYWEAFLGGAPSCNRCHDTCEKVQCGENKKCIMTKKGPSCVCSPRCSKAMMKGKICGTDGKTYRSQCRLQTRNCRRHLKVGIAYHGKCRKSCKKVKCLDGSCLQDQNGHPHCIPCTKSCLPAMEESEQICGSDSLTYDSICHIRKVACENAFRITILYPGKCRANTTCDNLKCPKDRKCLLDQSTGQPKCVMCGKFCLSSDVKHHPVCGTNGVSYKNFCEMRQTACSSGVIIQRKRMGRCRDGSDLVNY